MSESGLSKAFDFDASRLAISPRMLVTLLALAISIGSGIAFSVYRQITTEKTVTNLQQEVRTGFEDLRDEIKSDRANTQTKATAFTDCLLAERANPKTFKCPMAAPVQLTEAVIPTKARRKARATAKVEEDSGWLSFFGPAQAKTK